HIRKRWRSSSEADEVLESRDWASVSPRRSHSVPRLTPLLRVRPLRGAFGAAGRWSALPPAPRRGLRQPPYSVSVRDDRWVDHAMPRPVSPVLRGPRPAPTGLLGPGAPSGLACLRG